MYFQYFHSGDLSRRSLLPPLPLFFPPFPSSLSPTRQRVNRFRLVRTNNDPRALPELSSYFHARFLGIAALFGRFAHLNQKSPTGMAKRERGKGREKEVLRPEER